MAKATVIKQVKKAEGKYKFKGKNKAGQETEITIEITNDTDSYTVEELATDRLPGTITDPKTGQSLNISWFTNFAIKNKDGDYIKNHDYTVKLPGLASRGASRVVLYYGEGNPTFYDGTITADEKITLNNGDPAAGLAP